MSADDKAIEARHTLCRNLLSKWFNPRACKEAIAAGADVNGMLSGSQTTLLHEAAAHSFQSASRMRLLLEAKADPEQRNGEGQTALHVAARRGHIDCMRQLLAAGATIDVVDHHGNTPLGLTAKTSHWQCFNLLIRAGANPHHINHAGESIFYLSTDRAEARIHRKLRSEGVNIRENHSAHLLGPKLIQEVQEIEQSYQAWKQTEQSPTSLSTIDLLKYISIGKEAELFAPAQWRDKPDQLAACLNRLPLHQNTRLLGQLPELANILANPDTLIHSASLDIANFSDISMGRTA